MDIATASIAALEDLIASLQTSLDEVRANPALASQVEWVEGVENTAHFATDFAVYAEQFAD